MKKNEYFFHQLLHVSLGTVISLILGFFTTPIITRMIHPDIYGQYSLFAATCSIFLMFMSLGLDQGYIRFYYKIDPDRRKTLLQFCLLLPLMYLMAFGWTGTILLERLTHLTSSPLKFLFVACVIVLLLRRFSMLVLRVQGRTKEYASINVIQKIAQVFFSLLFIILLGSTNEYAMPLAYTLAYACSGAIGVWLSRAEFRVSGIMRWRWELPYRELLKYSVPLLISGGMFNIFQSLDKYCLNYYMDYTDVGIYSSAQHLMAVFSIVQTSFNTVWTPQAIKHYESNPSDTVFFKRMHEYIVIAMMSFGVAVLLLREIYVLLLGESYREAMFVIPFLMLNPMMYTISETTVSGLYFRQKTSWVVLIVVISSIANLIGNILLIPAVGIRGAAISTGLSYILFFILRTFFSNHFFRVDFQEYRLYVVLVLYILLASYLSYYRLDLAGFSGCLLVMISLVFLYKSAFKDLFGMVKKKMHL